MKKTKGNVSLKELFVETRARIPGRSYKESNENTTSKIAEMEEIETQMRADGSQPVDVYSAVTGPEHPGHLRLDGRGVTKTSLKGKDGNFEPTSNAANDVVQQMQEKIQKWRNKRELCEQKLLHT
ncbi:uncharacterized protein LOC132641131 isoform X2 [Lycium barbarum]|uniref:uncharacterized protein LOC132641131 isoform X2 n=1 Tax=Lycium barbarum TaxID=112863 RepID=UPI00293E8108|nr:uncharacterized protein LOC132641131 isoform X2 [Lycium barbarum]